MSVELVYSGVQHNIYDVPRFQTPYIHTPSIQTEKRHPIFAGYCNCQYNDRHVEVPLSSSCRKRRTLSCFSPVDELREKSVRRVRVARNERCSIKCVVIWDVRFGDVGLISNSCVEAASTCRWYIWCFPRMCPAPIPSGLL